jgi:hypothetical protein
VVVGSSARRSASGEPPPPFLRNGPPPRTGEEIPYPADEAENMQNRMTKLKEIVKERWLTYSAFIMFPISLAAFFTALYYMFHDVL